MFQIIEGFIEEYIDQNPISQLGIIVTRDKRATMISELGGNAKKHIAALKEHFGNQSSLSGEPSLMNSLNLAINSLHMLPAHTSREVVFIMASLTTCDPGGIHFTIQVSMLWLFYLITKVDISKFTLRCKKFWNAEGFLWSCYFASQSCFQFTWQENI